jgi:3-hydroxyacyl-CoA dehydrogenase
MRKLNYETGDLLAHGRPACARPSLAGRVGIIGAGTLGVNLAVNFLHAGIPVTLFEFEQTALDEASALTRSRCQDAGSGDRSRFLLSGTLKLHHLKDCDLILQVSAEVGADLFQRLGEFAKPGAILITTTLNPAGSYIAGYTRRPDALPDSRFAATSPAFHPWQFVCGNGTAAETLAGGIALSRELCAEAGISEDYQGS